MLNASDDLVAEQQNHTSYPRRFSTPMKDVLAMQLRFEHRRGARAHRLLGNRRFRAAYDFLLIRAACGEVDQELADWWTNVQTLTPVEQRKAFSLQSKRSNRHHSAN